MNRKIALLRKPHRMFNHFAPFYAWLVNNPLWRESVRELARHLPPSGATLRLVDVGCGPTNNARELVKLRPDVQVIGLDASIQMIRRARKAITVPEFQERIRLAMADALRLPIRESSVDAILLHSVYYMLDDQPGFLAEAYRVLRPGGRLIMIEPARGSATFGGLFKNLRALPSLIVWQSVSLAYTRFTPEQIGRELSAVGFARVLGETVVHGFGVLSRGEKPYPSAPPVETTATETTAAEIIATEISVSASDPPSVITARNLFLLIKQTPNLPAWEIMPANVITWGAASAFDLTTGQPTVLAFSSILKAVAFMQHAIRNGQIIGVTRVAKFPATARDSWEFPILINPEPGFLTGDAAHIRYTLPGPFVGVDPAHAILGEE